MIWEWMEYLFDCVGCVFWVVRMEVFEVCDFVRIEDGEWLFFIFLEFEGID